MKPGFCCWTKKHMVKAIWPFEVNEFASGMIIIYDSTILQVDPTLKRMVPSLKNLQARF